MMAFPTARGFLLILMTVGTVGVALVNVGLATALAASIFCSLLAASFLLAQFSLGLLQGTGAQMARTTQCFAVFVPFVLWLWLDPALACPRRARQWGAAVCAAAVLAVELVSLTGTLRFNRDRWQYEADILTGAAARLDDTTPSSTPS